MLARGVNGAQILRVRLRAQRKFRLKMPKHTKHTKCANKSKNRRIGAFLLAI